MKEHTSETRLTTDVVMSIWPQLLFLHYLQTSAQLSSDFKFNVLMEQR